MLRHAKTKISRIPGQSDQWECFMPTPTMPLPQKQEFDVAGLCRHFSELSPQPMLAVEGTTHKIRYANAAFSHLAGKNQAELIGLPFAEAVPEGAANGCLTLLDRVYRTGAPEILAEQEHETGQVPPVYWSYSMWAIPGIDDQPVGVMVQVTDATEIMMFRRQAVEMNGRLLISSTRQHELTEAAEKANRLKDDFLAVVSHELRTPLAVIIGWADILGNSGLDAETSMRGIGVLQHHAWIQAQMIDDLLDVARIANGKMHINLASVDLSAVVSSATEGLRPMAAAKEIRLYLQLDSTVGQVSGDEVRLQQVVTNLISNAIKFTPNGGNVRIRLRRLEAFVQLTVTDTGKGIAPEFLPHVFDHFQQADASPTRKTGGLGLGLSIVRQLVELHGGTVRVTSEGEGLGSTFTVDIPLVATRVPETGRHDDAVASAGTTEVEYLPELQQLRVLVVDDEADTCDLLKVILEGCGAQVKTANSAAAALEAVAEEVFDVLISDIGMPEEDGYSLMAKVQALGSEHGGKIPAAAALTAYVGEQDRIGALQAGFQIHIPKPISHTQLVAIIADLAGREKSN